MPSDLNERQWRFCQEYLIDCNGKQAAIRAGYAPHSAEVTGSRLLRNAKVKARIADLQAKRAKRVGLEADQVLEVLGRVIESNIDDYTVVDEETGGLIVDFRGTTRNQKGMVQKVKSKANIVPGSEDGERRVVVVETEFTLVDKLAAIDKVMRHLGMFEADNRQQGKEVAEAIERSASQRAKATALLLHKAKRAKG